MQQSLNIRKFTGFAFIELALWGDANLRTDNPAMRKSKELKAMKADKEKFVAGLIARKGLERSRSSLFLQLIGRIFFK